MQGSHFKNNRFTFRMLSAGLGAAVVMVTGNVNMSRTCSPYKESSTCRPLSLSLSLCVSSVPAKPQAASSWHHMVAEWLLQHFIRARARLPKQRARSPLCWYLERKKKAPFSVSSLPLVRKVRGFLLLLVYVKEWFVVQRKVRQSCVLLLK